MTTLGVALLFIPTVLAATGAYLRPDLRRPMLWGGLLAVPILLVFPLTFHFLHFPFGLLRLVTLFMFGAVAAAAYEVLFSKHFKLHSRSRQPLLWLLVGPIIFLVGVMSTAETVSPLICALLVEVGIVVAFRRDLVWDVLFSGAAMALFYVSSTFLLVRILGVPSNLGVLAETTFSGFTLLGIPVEEIVAVALFGALWGPMYPAFKDLKLKKR